MIFELEKSYNEFKLLLGSDVKFILFEHMISDLSYLKHIFMYFGIDDVELTKEMQMKKINKTKVIKYRDISEFNPDIQNRIMRIKDTYKEIKCHVEA